jgi:hypothetical protein
MNNFKAHGGRMRSAWPPGRSQERLGDESPRGMIAHDSYFAVEAIQPRAAARARVVRRLYFNE